MQVKLQPRSTFTFLLVLAFLYLAYLIFFASGDGFPEIDIDLKDIARYTGFYPNTKATNIAVMLF